MDESKKYYAIVEVELSWPGKKFSWKKLRRDWNYVKCVTDNRYEAYGATETYIMQQLNAYEGSVDSKIVSYKSDGYNSDKDIDYREIVLYNQKDNETILFRYEIYPTNTPCHFENERLKEDKFHKMFECVSAKDMKNILDQFNEAKKRNY